MANKKGKNGRVEILRFIFAVIILLFHIDKRFGPVDHFFNRGYIGVEFFFLVSGYLLAAGCFAKRNVPVTAIGTETAGMIWKKIKNIFPYHFFAISLTMAVNAVLLYDNGSDRFHYIIESWASVFFIQIFGFDSTWVNKLTWYLDVWLVVTFIFYIFVRKHYDVFVKIVCPILALAILGYIDHEYGKLSNIDVWTGHFYKCFLRGMAEMALGCSAFSLTRRINKIEFTKAGKVILGILEFIGYLLVVLYSLGGYEKYNSHYEFIALFILMGCLILTFSDINPGEKFFSGRIFDWFGKMSLLIYLNQFYVIRLVQEFCTDMSFALKTVLCLVFTLLGSVICNGLVGYFVDKQPIKKLMIAGDK